MQLRFLFLSFISTLLVSTVQSHAVEPWADKKLSVTNGLEIWLDASKEISARAQAAKKSGDQISSKIINGSPVDRWHDASGNRRDFRQLISSARPRFIQHSGGAAF